MAKRGPQKDDKFKAAVVAVLIGQNYPSNKFALKEIADRYNVNPRTLLRWYKGEQGAPPPEYVEQTKEGIAEMLDDIIFGIAKEVKRRIAENDIDDATLPQLMTSLGIGIDKHQLLVGKPTNINEERVSDSRDRLAQQLDRLAAVSEATEPTQYTN